MVMALIGLGAVPAGAAADAVDQLWIGRPQVIDVALHSPADPAEMMRLYGREVISAVKGA